VSPQRQAKRKSIRKKQKYREIDIGTDKEKIKIQ